MRPTAIVYTSNTGFTARYADMLGDKTGLPVYTLSEAKEALPKGEPILYLSWLRASCVVDYAKVNRRYTVLGVCAVGLCETGSLLAETRKATHIPEDIPLFTVQGGMDHTKLQGINKFMINTLLKVLSKQKNQTEDDEKKLSLIRDGGDFVKDENLSAVLAYLNAGC